MSVFDRIGDKSAEIQKKNHNIEIKKDIKKNIVFTFETDDTTLDFLKNQTIKLNNSMSKAYTELGSILYETQNELSNNKNGIFEKWYIDLGFTKKQVYRWINRYEFLSCQNDTIKNLIETLPITLSYEISNPNCNKELIEKVLNGNIKTLKEFNENKKNLLEFTLENKKEIENFVELDILENKIKEVERLNSQLHSDRIKNLEENKKEQLVKAIEKFEKTLNKILN